MTAPPGDGPRPAFRWTNPVIRGLAPDPADRFPDAMVMTDELDALEKKYDEGQRIAQTRRALDINETIAKLEPMLQTALMMTIGLIVLWLAMSVLGPIYDTISTIEI